MTSSETIDGISGSPTLPAIPDRSLRRITNCALGIEDHYGDAIMTIGVRAIADADGANVSELRFNIERVGGVWIEEEVTIIYRNGLFRKATYADAERTIPVRRLSEALEFFRPDKLSRQ